MEIRGRKTGWLWAIGNLGMVGFFALLLLDDTGVVNLTGLWRVLWSICFGLLIVALPLSLVLAYRDGRGRARRPSR